MDLQDLHWIGTTMGVTSVVVRLKTIIYFCKCGSYFSFEGGLVVHFTDQGMKRCYMASWGVLEYNT